MLPISITMFATSAIGSRLSNRFAVRRCRQARGGRVSKRRALPLRRKLTRARMVAPGQHRPPHRGAGGQQKNG